MIVYKLLKVKLRSCLIHSRLHLLLQPMAEFGLRSSYAVKFAKWYYDNELQRRRVLKQRASEIKHHNRFKLHQLVLENENLNHENFDYLEFGVFQGEAIRWWSENNDNLESRFFGFDTFTGLPEDWGKKKQGTFSTKGKPPQIDDSRCEFIVGLFQDSVPGFLQKYDLQKRTILHLDADLYSSTLFVLSSLAPKLKRNDILIFDEFTSWTHEFRAFQDFISAYRFDYTVMGTINQCRQIALMLNGKAN